jgi:hypothetical protein
MEHGEPSAHERSDPSRDGNELTLEIRNSELWIEERNHDNQRGNR